MDEKADDRPLAYEEIAAEQRMLFDWFRGDEIFVLLHSHDVVRLNRYQRIFGWGKVGDGATTIGAINTAKFTLWGRYVWNMKGEEAYQFCLGIRSYLAKYDGKRHGWCQQCIAAHENNRHK